MTLAVPIKDYEKTSTPLYFNDEIFKWDSRFYMRIGTSPLKFFVIDYENLTIEEVRVVKFEEEYRESGKIILANFSVYAIVKYLPLSRELSPLYEFHLILDEGGKVMLPPQTFTETIGQLKEIAGAVARSNKIVDTMNNAVTLANKIGKLITKKDPPYPGFFYIDKEILSTVKYEDPSVTEMKEALEEIHQFSDHFQEFKEQLNFILHWMVMAPFSFFKKQRGDSDKLGTLYMYGSSRAGKTIIAMLSCHIWKRDIDKSIVGAGMLHSEASFGKNVSESTFPVILDEGERIFSKKNEGLLATFKNSVFYTNVRGRYNPSSGRYEQIPALAPMIMTSNASHPTNAALGARLNTLEFMMDKNRTKDEIREFNNKFDPENPKGPLNKLQHIGAFTATYIEANKDILDESWGRAAEIIWEAIYDYAEISMPEWMNKCKDASGLDEAWEAEEEEIYTAFRRLVLRNAEVYGLRTDGKIFEVTIGEKIDDVVFAARETWIRYFIPSTGKYKGQEFVEIDAGICRDLEKDSNLNISLKLLCSKLGGKYTVTSRAGRKVKVARWRYKEFVEMMV